MVEFQPSAARGGVRAEIDAGLRAHMNKVYGLMSIAMVVTFAVAFFVGSTPSLVQAIFGTPLRWVVMFAPLIAVLGLSFGIHKLSLPTATGVFYGFAAIMGLSISFIFAAFNLGTIATAFLATAVAFLSLSLYGYTTNRDLSGLGRFLMMGLIGVIVLSILGLFIDFGGPFRFALNVAILLIFAGLTAYDTQRIKNEYLGFAEAGAHGSPEGREWMGKAALMGALGLYLNFINMFMVILQFMGASEE